jgi:hypothetical protein
MAGALLFDEKIHQSPALFWFGLRNDETLYLRAAFLEHGLAKRLRFEHMQTVIQTGRRIRGLFT